MRFQKCVAYTFALGYLLAITYSHQLGNSVIIVELSANEALKTTSVLVVSFSGGPVCGNNYKHNISN